MNEKLQQLGRTLLGHADRTTTALLGILCLAMVGLFMNEQSKIENPPKEPPPNPFQEPLPNEQYEALVKDYLTVNEDIAQNLNARRLTEFNMFDLKSVKAQEELAKQMDNQVDEAERLIQSGRKEEALKVLDSVLARRPDHVRALDLRNQIVPQPTPTPAVSPSPTS